VRDIGTNEKLHGIAKDWNLRKYLKENPSQRGEEPKTALASTVEAILGAVWVDSERNFEAVHHAVKKFQS
jgi:ribonuclease-3